VRVVRQGDLGSGNSEKWTLVSPELLPTDAGDKGEEGMMAKRRYHAKNPRKWFQFAVSGKPTGWKKTDPPAVRRRKMLRAKGGNYLRAARALQALANVTKDGATKRAARSDALYFYRKYKARR
jgi:hypothetical protein